MSIFGKSANRGFTIVELLIVIVVIAILAAISIVAYSGIQNRANDTAVQSDLATIGKKILAYHAVESAVPINTAEFATMGVKASTTAYGSHYFPTANSAYNMAYCYNYSDKTKFIIVAASKSGNVYAFRDGKVALGTGPMQTVYTTCSNNGLSSSVSYIWLYSSNVWQAGLDS